MQLCYVVKKDEALQTIIVREIFVADVSHWEVLMFRSKLFKILIKTKLCNLLSKVLKGVHLIFIS